MKNLSQIYFFNDIHNDIQDEYMIESNFYVLFLFVTGEPTQENFNPLLSYIKNLVSFPQVSSLNPSFPKILL